MKHLVTPQFALVFALFALLSCDDENEVPSLRNKIDYATLTPETEYAGAFVDSEGTSTVDLTDGNDRLKMFQALNYYSSSSIEAETEIDATVLENMFSNTGNPFTDIATSRISVSGDELNASPVQLRNVTASSLPEADAEAVRQQIESYFSDMHTISLSASQTASAGVAGKLGSRLVDEKGIELAQIIQKSLIGALQLDYIANVLLDEGLHANNTKPVTGRNYTELEHNWDVAYGLLTLNPVYLAGSTDAEKGTTESFAGSYIWEYNKAHYADIYPAFLKGRAAIVNNDKAQYQAQALFIRTEFERTIAMAALGYLGKWKTGETDADRAHAMGEGLGFIYSLRFATLHDVDAAFSDALIDGLIGSENGFWDLDAAKINAASDAIKAKFAL